MNNCVMNIAIIGGGPGCKALMHLFETMEMTELKTRILGVADTDTAAPGLQYARQKGLLACTNYRDLFGLKDLDLLIELTGSDQVLSEVIKSKPDHVRVIDHVSARLFWDIIQIEEEKNQIEQKYQAERNLSEARKQYKTLVENIRDLVFSLDTNGDVTYISPAVRDLLGYLPKELMGGPFRTLLLPAHYAQIEGILAEAKGDYCFECAFRGKSGNEKIMRLSVHTLTPDGLKAGFSGIAHDMTDRIKAEQKVIRSNQILRAIHDLTLDVSKNTDEFLTALCERIHDLFGGDFIIVSQQKNGLLASRASYSLPVELAETYRGSMAHSFCSQVMKTNQTINFSDLQKMTPGKDSKVLNRYGITAYLGTPLRSSSEDVIGVLGYYDSKPSTFSEDDIKLFEILAQRASTELEREYRQREKETLQEQLFQSQKMEAIGTLAGGIAHDFNNLLSGILGYASYGKMLLPEGHTVRRHLEVIEKSAERSAELVRQMLGFSRGGKYEVKLVDCNQVIEDVVKLLYHTINKSISIETHLSSDLARILADTVQVQQVILNVCINARDAMPDGGRLTLATENTVLDELYARRHLGTELGEYVRISIIDTGIGMDHDIKRRIFEPFFTTKEKGKGTGLGLAMVYGIAKNHGGYVDFYSEKDMGTRFNIYFPASRGNEPEISDPPQVQIVGGEETILLIDDEETIRELGKEVLESLGYKVILAADGAEALSIYKKNEGLINLVMLDIVMPKIGGKETFLQLKFMNPQVKVILSSGYSIDGEARDILCSGASAFIQKPYRINELSTIIRRTLEQ